MTALREGPYSQLIKEHGLSKLEQASTNVLTQAPYGHHRRINTELEKSRHNLLLWVDLETAMAWEGVELKFTYLYALDFCRECGRPYYRLSATDDPFEPAKQLLANLERRHKAHVGSMCDCCSVLNGPQVHGSKDMVFTSPDGGMNIVGTSREDGASYVYRQIPCSVCDNLFWALKAGIYGIDAQSMAPGAWTTLQEALRSEPFDEPQVCDACKALGVPVQNTQPAAPASTLCPRCGRLLYDRESCSQCGYPGLLQRADACRHVHLRVRYDGKVECLEPGCKAIFTLSIQGWDKCRPACAEPPKANTRLLRAPDGYDSPDVQGVNDLWVCNDPPVYTGCVLQVFGLQVANATEVECRAAKWRVPAIPGLRRVPAMPKPGVDIKGSYTGSSRCEERAAASAPVPLVPPRDGKVTHYGKGSFESQRGLCGSFSDSTICGDCLTLYNVTLSSNCLRYGSNDMDTAVGRLQAIFDAAKVALDGHGCTLQLATENHGRWMIEIRIRGFTLKDLP